MTDKKRAKAISTVLGGKAVDGLTHVVYHKKRIGFMGPDTRRFDVNFFFRKDSFAADDESNYRGGGFPSYQVFVITNFESIIENASSSFLSFKLVIGNRDYENIPARMSPFAFLINRIVPSLCEFWIEARTEKAYSDFSIELRLSGFLYRPVS